MNLSRGCDSCLDSTLCWKEQLDHAIVVGYVKRKEERKTKQKKRKQKKTKNKFVVCSVCTVEVKAWGRGRMASVRTISVNYPQDKCEQSSVCALPNQMICLFDRLGGKWPQ